MQEPVVGISAIPDESNARYFHVLVTGPDEVKESKQFIEAIKINLILKIL
jgi:hypothetical protein